ncbi:MAG: hypothetical protein QM831_31510 [Kofleriaceae bacterium]
MRHALFVFAAACSSQSVTNISNHSTSESISISMQIPSTRMLNHFKDCPVSGGRSDSLRDALVKYVRMHLVPAGHTVDDIRVFDGADNGANAQLVESDVSILVDPRMTLGILAVTIGRNTKLYCVHVTQGVERIDVVLDHYRGW